MKHTWSVTRSRSQSIPHDAPAGCLRTLIFDDREKVCAELLCPPQLRAASPRWQTPAGRSRASSARSAACCHTSQETAGGMQLKLLNNQSAWTNVQNQPRGVQLLLYVALSSYMLLREVFFWLVAFPHKPRPQTLPFSIIWARTLRCRPNVY